MLKRRRFSAADDWRGFLTRAPLQWEMIMLSRSHTSLVLFLLTYGLPALCAEAALTATRTTCVSANGKFLVVQKEYGSFRSSSLEVWDTKASKRVAQIPAKSRMVAIGGEAIDDHGFLLARDGDRVRGWSCEAGSELFAFDISEPVFACAISPDRHTLLVSKFREGSWRRTGLVEMWDITDKKKVAEVPGPSVGCPEVSFLADGSKAILAEVEGRLLLLDVPKNRIAWQVNIGKDEPSGLCELPDGKGVLCAGTGPKLDEAVIVDLGTGKVKAVLKGHRDMVLAAGYIAQLGYLVTLGRERIVCIWDALKREPLYCLEVDSKEGSDAKWFRAAIATPPGTNQVVIARTVMVKRGKREMYGVLLDNWVLFVKVSWWDLKERKCLRSAMVTDDWKDGDCTGEELTESLTNAFKGDWK